MKIVINKCYGGFGLSPKGLQAWAKKKNRKCYFFDNERKKGKIDFDTHNPISLEEAKNAFCPSAFDIPNPDEILKRNKPWNKMTKKEAQRESKLYKEHSLYDGNIERTDPDLIAIVEEMGKEADGSCAELKVVDIPDGIGWTIEEYDGTEWVAEAHETWS